MDHATPPPLQTAATLALSPQPRLWKSVAAALALHGGVVLAIVLIAWPLSKPVATPKADAVSPSIALSFAAPLARAAAESIIPVDLASLDPLSPAPSTPPDEPTEQRPAPDPQPAEPLRSHVPVPVLPPKPVIPKKGTPPKPPLSSPTTTQGTPAFERAASEAEENRAAVSSPPGTAAGKSVEAPPSWQADLLAHLNRHKVYPRQARLLKEQGVATVRAIITGDGLLAKAEMHSSSGSQSLDAESLDLLQRAQPLPVPAGMAKSDSVAVLLPLRFSLR